MTTDKIIEVLQRAGWTVQFIGVPFEGEPHFNIIATLPAIPPANQYSARSELVSWIPSERTVNEALTVLAGKIGITGE